MICSRSELYAQLGTTRIRFPQYVNFGLPLTDQSEFGFRIRATVRNAGDAAEIAREYFIKGKAVSEDELNTAVMEARDHHADALSARRPGVPTEFPGVAFDYELIQS